MADFHQQGIITTLHPLFETFDREEYLSTLEAKLKVYSESRRISLLLPCLFSEIQSGDVLARILQQLKKVEYLHNIVVALGGTSRPEDFREALEYFSVLPGEASGPSRFMQYPSSGTAGSGRAVTWVNDRDARKG